MKNIILEDNVALLKVTSNIMHVLRFKTKSPWSWANLKLEERRSYYRINNV